MNDSINFINLLMTMIDRNMKCYAFFVGYNQLQIVPSTLLLKHNSYFSPDNKTIVINNKKRKIIEDFLQVYPNVVFCDFCVACRIQNIITTLFGFTQIRNLKSKLYYHFCSPNLLISLVSTNFQLTKDIIINFFVKLQKLCSKLTLIIKTI